MKNIFGQLFIATLIFCVTSAITTQQSIAQDNSGLIGIGVQFSTPPPYSNLFIPAPSMSMEMTPDILISLRLSKTLQIEPSLGLFTLTDQSFWRFGMTVALTLREDIVSPYVLFRSKAYLSDINGQSISDYVFGIGVGGEYFINKKVSLSIESQLQQSVSQKDFSLFVRKNVLYTAMSVSTIFYLN